MLVFDLSYFNWGRKTIGIGVVELLVVDQIFIRYIGICGVEPLVVENIIDCYQSSVRQMWYFIILRFFWSKKWGSLGKLSSIEAATAWSRGTPCKILKITHNYLIFLFYSYFLVHSLIISRSTELIFYPFKIVLE